LGPAVTMSPPRKSGSGLPGLSSVQELTGIERPTSRGSVNFSLPTSSRQTSPVSPRRLTSPELQRTYPQRIAPANNSHMVYDPNTRSFLPLSEILAIEQRIQNAATMPTKKKKKRISPKQNTGTHLADGTIGGRPRGTAIDEMEAARQASTSTVKSPAQVQLPLRAAVPTSASAEVAVQQTTRVAATAPKKTPVGVATDSDSDDQQSYVPNSSDNESDFSSPPRKFNTRAGALLAKKPSIVREDKEGEEEEHITPRTAGVPSGLGVETTPVALSPSPVPRSSAGRGYGRGQASASAAFAQGRQHARSASQPAPVPAASDAGATTLTELGPVARGHSASPARATHFAPTPDHLAVKHSPPARSISPRKSALKQSSSDTPRSHSPAVGFGYGSNVSETSNGSASAGELEEAALPKKKAVRVSFDENNVVVGQAAGQELPSSSFTESSQQELPAKRNWLSLSGRAKKKEANITADDDEVMQPRPALPSFGSVRERKQTRGPVEERPLVKPAELVDGVGSTLDSNEHPLGQSNDHLMGAIISQDAASKNAANISKSREPLPPLVTTVEGSGYSSDGDSTIGRDSLDHEDEGSVTMSHAPPTSGFEITDMRVTGTADEERTNEIINNGDVPKISISRATPPSDEAHKRKEWLHIPGAWSLGANSDSGSQTPGDSPTSEHHALGPTPATVGIAEPLPDEAQQGSPVLGNIAAEKLHDHAVILEETEESDASIYSDAAEELSDIEGGFMSLDAVVESPVLASRSLGIGAGGEEYLKNNIPNTSAEPAIDDSWEKAQRYWGSLSADKKLRLEQEAREQAEASDSTIEAPKPTPKPKKKKPAAQQAPPGVLPKPQPIMNERAYMIAPGSKAPVDSYIPTMRSSMRAERVIVPSETHMRMSMRSQGVMRNSMREPPQMAQQRGSLVKKNRPLSLSAPINIDAAAVNAHVKALTAVAAKNSSRRAQAPVLQRRGSGESDSSFKRSRASENTTFRRSMKESFDSPSGRQLSPTESSRFSLRSLSPTGSGIGRRPFSSAAPSSTPPKSMRTSMRNSGAAKSPIRIPGFGRASSSQPPKGKLSRQHTSRFADSSDEEEVHPSFQSRFVDSSDDDEVPAPSGAGSVFGRGTMRANQAVRGIPRKPGVEDGDSSDLPDSDDEVVPASPGLKLAKRPNGSTTVITSQGPALASGSLRRSGSGRGATASPTTPTRTLSTTRSRGANLMAILRRRKPDPSSKVRKAEIESAARRDTPLERSKYDLQAIKRNDSYNSVGSGKLKLQKRNASTSWPLPPPEHPAVERHPSDVRPSTANAAEGVVGAELSNGIPALNGETAPPPELGARRFTAQGVPGELDLNGVGKRPKKKFGMLRRIFRLDE
jgi:serine/arginine repetitive matrix protein 2